MEYSLIFPAFIAGLLTFLAPCTLPLAPGFLAFITGSNDHGEVGSKQHRLAIFWNAIWYVLGFSAIFIILGALFGLGGAALIQYQSVLSRIGGVFVIIFGLFLIGGSQWKIFRALNSEKRYHPGSWLKPGKPSSSFIFGATFAFGWTPCIGPILGSILLLASTSATVGQGIVLLSVFALGLAIPFLLLAATVSSAKRYLKILNKYLPLISKFGGVFLLFLGILLLTDSLQLWTGYAFRLFSVFNYDALLDYL